MLPRRNAERHGWVSRESDRGSPVNPGRALATNSSLTDSRINTTIVKTPRTVPKGINMHSRAPTTMQYVRDVLLLRCLPAMMISFTSRQHIAPLPHVKSPQGSTGLRLCRTAGGRASCDYSSAFRRWGASACLRTATFSPIGEIGDQRFEQAYLQNQAAGRIFSLSDSPPL